MPNWIEEILKSDVKPKEKVTLLAERVDSDEAVADLMEYCKKAPTSDKGHCVEALTVATERDPQLGETCIGFVIDLLSEKTPRVKWEASRVIGNVAKEFPERAAKAIPRLLVNTEDSGTVVRWSTAFALTEIAKANPQTRSRLTPLFAELVEKEENSGVNKIYAKALKSLAKAEKTTER